MVHILNVKLNINSLFVFIGVFQGYFLALCIVQADLVDELFEETLRNVVIAHHVSVQLELVEIVGISKDVRLHALTVNQADVDLVLSFLLGLYHLVASERIYRL